MSIQDPYKEEWPKDTSDFLDSINHELLEIEKPRGISSIEIVKHKYQLLMDAQSEVSVKVSYTSGRKRHFHVVTYETIANLYERLKSENAVDFDYINTPGTPEILVKEISAFNLFQAVLRYLQMEKTTGWNLEVSGLYEIDIQSQLKLTKSGFLIKQK